MEKERKRGRGGGNQEETPKSRNYILFTFLSSNIYSSALVDVNATSIEMVWLLYMQFVWCKLLNFSKGRVRSESLIRNVLPPDTQPCQHLRKVVDRRVMTGTASITTGYLHSEESTLASNYLHHYIGKHTFVNGNAFTSLYFHRQTFKHTSQ